jgi:hypothetical protein
MTDNSEYFDLISTSIFGLQADTKIFLDPVKFGIIEIKEEERTILDPKLSYKVKEGLSNEEAVKLRDNYKKTILNINKYPKVLNYFREIMLISL